jgi:putative SOS response-associated peptidase YedK
MCVNFVPVSKDSLAADFGASIQGDLTWPAETYKDYLAPIIVSGDNGDRVAMLASFGMVPHRHHIPTNVKKWDTMNARAETVGEKRSYAKYWRAGQLCLVPMAGFFEPCYETGNAVRWRIGIADQSPFAVAGLWRSWLEDDGTSNASFTELTIAADDHPLMRRFHKPGDEKRSLVIVPADDYDAWLACLDPEVARSFLGPYAAELMAATPAPKAAKAKPASAQRGLEW